MSTKKISTTKQGFTIIEVVLVLAIAGLIFLMVFVALPALQRSQRDTQRRSDIARVASTLTQWQTNHNNGLPSAGNSGTTGTDAKTFLDQYLNAGNGTFTDPDGTAYTIVVASGAKAATHADFDNLNHTIYIQTGANCDNTGSATAASNNDYAIMYKTEASGVICNDNS